MKKLTFILSFCLIVLGTFVSTTLFAKDPVIVEVTTSYKTVKEALIATKTSLMKRKFIPSGGVGESGFTATRTTGSHSDYYTADVMAEQTGATVKVTITFIKSGSGMLKLSNVAEEIKAELSGTSPTGSVTSNQSSPSMVATTSTVSKSNFSEDCLKFKKLKKTGLILLIAGGAVALTGIFLVADGTYTGTTAGSVLVPLGLIAAGGGLTVSLIGNSKCKKSCALNLKVNANSLGLAMNF